MKKRTIFAVAAVSLILATGCGAQPSSQPVSSAEETVSTQVSESADTPSAEASPADTDVKTSSITGTIDEIKDFMFHITDSEGTSFVLSFDATPEGLSDVKNGDTVTVTYTGELSEVDAFTGTVISVKKAEK